MEKDNSLIKYYIAMIALVAILALMLFFGIIGDKNTVEMGDTVHVNYTGRFLDGTVFDTSDLDVAKSAGIYQEGRQYEPLEFQVGSGAVIPGFENGVLGMKVGEKKTLIIPPEDAYGHRDPSKIEVLPLIDELPATQSYPNSIEVSQAQFAQDFGTDHKVGDTVQVPESTLTMTVAEMNETTVNLSFDLGVGDRFSSSQVPWEEEVIEENSTHFLVRHNVKVGDILEFPNRPWNSTVTAISDTNITLKHNPIEVTTLDTLFGSVQIEFNETGIIVDKNNRMAGKTLMFEVKIVSIEN
jgi:FKBP-type peptidyl-prolyl cis-trans isomerase 2